MTTKPVPSLRAVWKSGLRFAYLCLPYKAQTKNAFKKPSKFLKAKEPQLVARLDGVCKRFVEAKNSGDEFATTLGILIAGIDTQIRLIDRMAEVLSGVIYFYWRVGFNSFQVAEQLGIKDAHVRQLTARMVETGIALGYPAPQPVLTRRPALPRLPTECAPH